MLKSLRKIFKNKKIILGIIVFIIAFGFLFSSISSVYSAESTINAVNDSTTIGKAKELGFFDYLNPVNWIPLALSWFLAILINAVGLLLTAITNLLVEVAQYNYFIKEAPVVTGWVVVRDICNMFFVLILLVIAFATILRIQSYEVKKALPKLIIMAILINFSKTICGLLIDFFQVIMLTFVNGFAAIAGGNFMTILGIDGLLSIKTNADNFVALELFTVASSYILALVYVVIALVVVGTILLTLVYRMVMIWIYVILSPVAYLAASFPQGQKYSSQWWSEFVKHLIGGPVLAFFLWLSLTTVSHISIVQPESAGGVTPADSLSAGVTQSGTRDSMIKFIVSISLLIGGLMVAQQIGGAAGMAAGKGMGALQSGRGLAWKGVKGGTDWLNRKQAKTTGVDLNPFRQADRLKKAFTRRKEDDLKKIRMKSSDNLERGGIRGLVTGFTSEGWADQYAQGFLGMKGLKKAVVGSAKGMYYSKNKGALSTGKAILGMGKGSEPYTEKLVEDLEINKLKHKGATATAEDHKEERDKLEAEEKKAKFDKNLKAEQKAQAKIRALDEGWMYNLENSSNSKDKAKKERYEKILESKDQRMKTAFDSGDTELYDKIAGEKREVASKIDKITKPKDDFIAATRKEAGKQQEEVGLYNVKDLEGASQTRSAIAEQSRNITSENEDELVADFRGAVAENNMPLAAAIAKQIVKIGGGNALLGNFGYSVRGGMTKEESNKLKSEGRTKEIEEKRGVNDFMRDIFGDKLKMGESAMLALQSDLGELAKNINHDYLAGTISANAKGKLYQVGEDDQAANIDNETSKGDSEVFARRANRLKYGAENKKTGKFEWSQSGLMLAAQNAGAILLEIEKDRFNRSAAKKFAEDEASDTLLKYLKKLESKGVQLKGKKGAEITSEYYVEQLKKYGKSGSKENLEKMKEAAKDFA
ncbi:MAG: hypothetical protein WC323_02530 [Patescibacteria group bacterium]|jgi:hypothetical protein